MTDGWRRWQPQGSLTDREMQVLREIHARKSLREIGHALSISQDTVRNHVRNIIEKLRLFGEASK